MKRNKVCIVTTTDKMATLAGTSRSRSKKGRFTSRKPRQKKVPVDANNNDICEDETAGPGSPLKWNEGRRIIELGNILNWYLIS